MLRLLFPLPAVALSACPSATTMRPNAAQAAGAPPPQKTVLDPQLRALQKAKDVSETIDDRQRRQPTRRSTTGGLIAAREQVRRSAMLRRVFPPRRRRD